MIQILEQATNAQGQTLLRTNRKGWHELVPLPAGMTVQAWLQAAREAELRSEGQRLIAAQDRQIDAVISAEAGLIGRQNLRTGHVAVFLHPATLDRGPSYDAPVLPDRLHATPRDQLEMQLGALKLIVDDRMSSEGARRSAQADIIRVQKLLALPDTPGT